MSMFMYSKSRVAGLSSTGEPTKQSTKNSQRKHASVLKSPDKWASKYLAALEKYQSQKVALKVADISRDSVWRHRKRSEAFKRAEQEILDRTYVDSGYCRRYSKPPRLVKCKARKYHECFLCGEEIEKGDELVVWNSWRSKWLCVDCGEKKEREDAAREEEVRRILQD